jgi:L-lactate dehydrogenase complex protein LldG
MSARDAILGRIRSALAGEPQTAQPQAPDLWPAGSWTPPPDLFAYFAQELARVQGEAYRCVTLDEARQRVCDLFRELGEPATVVIDEERCRSATAALPADMIHIIEPTWDRDKLAMLPLAVMPAPYLLADSGTAVLLPRSSAERLLCYLPTVAILVASSASVVPHLSDVWEDLSRRAREVNERGETLLVTGPSRTADIEKKLILGAHGPKRVIVLAVDTPPLAA